MIRKIAAITFLFFAAGTFARAQNKSAISDAMMDKLFIKFKQIQKASAMEKQQEMKDFEAALDKALAVRFAAIQKMQQEDEQLKRDYRPGYQHKPGEMNLFPIFEDIPAPVPSLPEAKTINFEQKYQAYIDRVEMMKNQLSDMEKQHIAAQRTSKDEMMNDTKKMANKNAVVQQMGGADAVMNMSEQERKNAAKGMKEKVLNDPGSFSGVSDPGMNEMMKKIMNDPSYRDKYNRMSDAEKQAELQKYMTNKVVPRDDRQFEQGLAEKNKVNYEVSIQQLLGRCLDRMKEGARPYASGTAIANEFYRELYNAIDQWYNKQYEALPVTVMGETKEKRGLGQLIKAKEILLYSVHKREAVTRTLLWNSLKLRTKLAFGEFNDFIGNFPWGRQKNASLVDGSYTEAKVADAVFSIYEQMIQLTKGAESLTSNHKGWQGEYETIMGLN